MSKLSPYTLAKNCTDLTDVKCGIEELRYEIRKKENLGQKVPYFFYDRLEKLKQKRRKFENPIFLVTNSTGKYNFDKYATSLDDALKLGMKLNVDSLIKNYRIAEGPVMTGSNGKSRDYKFSIQYDDVNRGLRVFYFSVIKIKKYCG